MPLLRKELRQHWWLLGLIALFALVSYGLIAFSVLARGDAGSVFEVLRAFVMTMAPLSALVLGRRLVVNEYQSRTQLFLEGLPVSRVRMITVKYLLGLCVLGTVLLGAVGVTWAVGGRAEEPGLVLAVCLRTGAFGWFIYNFFFMMGFLGRYRVALFLAMFITLFALTEVTDLELQRFGPVVLVNEKFSYETELPPTDAITTTLGLATAFLGLTFLIGGLREGSVAALLAERMSHRERVVAAALLVGSLFAVMLLHEKRFKEPFDLHGAVVGRVGQVEVKVSPLQAEAPVQALATRAAHELDALQAYLGLEEMVPVFITSRPDLDPDAYERGTLNEAEGLLVRANYGSVGWDEEHFMNWLVREVLISQSHGRVKLEPKMWVLDGFALFWARRAEPATALSEEPRLALRALYGTRAGFEEMDLKNWYRFRERVGHDVAAAVAWSGLNSLLMRQGQEPLRQFLQSILGANLSKDIRAYLHERDAPLSRLLEAEAGVELDDFLQGWQADLASARARLEADLARLPTMQAELEFVPLSADTRKARYRLGVDPPLADGARYSIVYDELPVLDAEVDPAKLRRIQNPYLPQNEGELPETLTRGARLYWAFSINVPELGCEVVSGWKREEVR